MKAAASHTVTISSVSIHRSSYPAANTKRCTRNDPVAFVAAVNLPLQVSPSCPCPAPCRNPVSTAQNMRFLVHLGGNPQKSRLFFQFPRSNTRNTFYSPASTSESRILYPTWTNNPFQSLFGYFNRSKSFSSSSSSPLSTEARRSTIMSAASVDSATHQDIHEVAKNLQTVRTKLQACSEQCSRSNVPRLVAVSKLKELPYICEAYRSGQRVFGENYVSELVEKAKTLAADPQYSDIEWHLIGPIQSNKCKVIVEIPNLSVVESVDRIKIAENLDKHLETFRNTRGNKPLQVMVQINVSHEDTKSGCDLSEAPALAEFIVTQCKNLKFIGIMCIGAPDTSAEPEAFKIMQRMQSEIASKLGVAASSLEMSMGMSDDYEAATRMGSTNVRIGSTIFGARPTKPKPVAAAVEKDDGSDKSN